MKYYQFNIGDYRKRTAHLTLVEHAIYRALIDTYYLEESPLCGDKAKLMRSHSVRTKEEKEAFNEILAEFFTLKDGEYHHEKCDQELAKIYEKSEKARASAKARWSERNANASKAQCERNANGMLPNTQDPIPSNNTPSASSASPSVPVQKIVDLYNELLGDKLHMVRELTDKRRKAVRARWKAKADRQSLEFWTRYFTYVSGQPFLINGSWCGFDWLMKEDNLVKVREGKYQERETA